LSGPINITSKQERVIPVKKSKRIVLKEICQPDSWIFRLKKKQEKNGDQEDCQNKRTIYG